jgi:hypothetical protein
MKRGLFLVGALSCLAFFSGCVSAPQRPSAVASYSVRYYPNGATGGSVPEDTTNYSTDAIVTVQGNNAGTLVNTGYAFDGWNTAPDGKGSTYDARGAFGPATLTMGAANVALYAVWKDPIVGPWNLTSVNTQSVALAPQGFQSMTLTLQSDDNTWSMTSTPTSGAPATSTGTWRVADTPTNYTMTSGNIVTFKATISGTTLTLTPTTVSETQVLVFSKQ